MKKNHAKYNSPFTQTTPYIGQIDTNLIPPPHTVDTLVKRICKKENKGFGIDWDTEDAFSTILFKEITSPTPYALEDFLSLLGEDRPGSNPVILKVGYKDTHRIFFKTTIFRSDTSLGLRELVGYM